MARVQASDAHAGEVSRELSLVRFCLSADFADDADCLLRWLGAGEKKSGGSIEWLEQDHVLIGKWESMELVGFGDNVESVTFEFSKDGSLTTVEKKVGEEEDDWEVVEGCFAVGNGMFHLIAEWIPPGNLKLKGKTKELFHYQLNGGN